MRAAVYSKTKSGKVLQIVDVERPVPKDNEVLIRTRAASVNPLDWRMKSPRPGVDVAGEVVAAGKHVTQFKPGDAVFGLCRGAFAEYACASEAELVPKPEHLTFEQAASIPIAGLTALQALRDRGHLQPRQSVLINGAAGGVGTFAVQIARSLGADVTGVCSTRNVEMVRSLGAAEVIDYTREDFTRNGRHYDVLLDNVGNHTFSELRRVLTPRGLCVLTGAPKQLWAALARMLKAFAWPPFLHQKFTFFIAKRNQDDLTTLCALMRTGAVTPVIDKRYQLSATADAIAYVEQGHARAKVVIGFE
ncbi:NAD(P)-dependent alcohol dehydrogenase [uncultured Paludibaculum sp.]|uniref:NAD(P)-dependent alcohol dehydrogenase n=1 Tax=uncultured Paludibaculum sp. TaxID=1765020 RepID=UPI002AABE8D1|nr:NAD(P)-dependent alcohol dehydrogenase [uncultured Paludibaculum sp.]